MEVLLPSSPLNSNILSECRESIEFDDFFLAKLAYINRNSDLDVFQLQGNERINHLICAWDTAFVLCRSCASEKRDLPDFLQSFISNLVHYSMSLWFSVEWEKCDFSLCCSLLVSMFRMRSKLIEIPCLSTLNWNYIMNIGVRPWEKTYFKEYMRVFGTNEKKSSPLLVCSVETVEPPATVYDIAHIQEEGFVLTLLRLMKLFDAGCMEIVKRFSMCAISAWNQEQHEELELERVYDNDLKRCLNMICHMHLMAVYERDSAVGFEIDNMMSNIRFYHKCITDAHSKGESFGSNNPLSHITPSHLFALTCVKLSQSVQDFIESVLPDLSRESCSSLFGAVSHAYATYLLGSILVEMNKYNKEDFKDNVQKYKRTMRAYVFERERSERFILEQVHKQKLQCTSHNVTCTVREITNFKAAIGKGNRSINLVNHKPSDVQSEQERAELFETENEKRYDPVFQTMPNDEIVTNEFYDVLSKTKYKGWHFAKLVLLLKIIGRELNDIENWCYHPGLTTEFMMALEFKLAKRFEDLAMIFQDNIFMEQEFWLTAFYLRPARHYYDKVIYCGTRFFRTVNLLNKGDKDEVMLKSSEKSADKGDEASCAFMNAKYGLLSSTFDVKQIAQMTSVDTSENDYDLLAKALRMLRLPENIIKDLLTVTFSPRHANFTWAAEWPILRKRCKMLLANPAYKRELVESNMAEANDRLKYLRVDYDKYKNWPQLDYGSIEEGYENDYIGDDPDDTDSDDDLYDDTHEKKDRTKIQQSESDQTIDDISFEERSSSEALDFVNEFETQGLRRSSTRRAAAVVASAMLKDDANSKLIKNKEDLQKKLLDHATRKIEKKNTMTATVEMPNRNANESTRDLLNYTNSTGIFREFTEISSHDKSKNNEIVLLEKASSHMTSEIFNKVKDLHGKFDPDNESDSSSRSDSDMFDETSIHDAMNVSDTETSDSSDGPSRNFWDELLPSFIVENNATTKSQNLKNDFAPVVGKEKEDSDTEMISIENDKENKSEMESKHGETQSCFKSHSKSQNSFDNQRTKEGASKSVIIQSVVIIPPISAGTTCNFMSYQGKDSHIVSVAPADCTDTASNNSHTNQTLYETGKDDEFVMSTTALQGGRDNSFNAETETIDDSIACYKTEEHESIDEEAVSFKTATEESNSQTNKVQIRKDEVHSTTEIENKPVNKQLTGKPKSFSEILGAQLLSEDSSSESSIGTQELSTQFRGSNTSEGIDSGQKAELIELCLRRKCFVQLERIQEQVLPPFRREPVVRIKRLNLDKFLQEKTIPQKRRNKFKPEFFYMEENSNPEPRTSKPRKRRHDTPQNSESDEEYNPKYSKESIRTANRRLSLIKKGLPGKDERSRGKSFSVVPRSASGLKVCISSLCDILPPRDCIEISSSSEGDVMEVATFSVQFANISRSVKDEDDPLFEEEADIELLR